MKKRDPGDKASRVNQSISIDERHLLKIGQLKGW